MTHPPQQPGSPPQGRVLVLEDDPRLQNLLLTVLRLENYEAEGVSTGSQALRAVEARQPDLLVLDLLVPEVSGWEVMQRLRSDPERAHIPILLVSSVQDLALEARRLGADDHLAKPFRVQELLGKVFPLVHKTGPAIAG